MALGCRGWGCGTAIRASGSPWDLMAAVVLGWRWGVRPSHMLVPHDGPQSRSGREGQCAQLWLHM